MRTMQGGMSGLGDAASDTFAAGSLLDSAAQTVAAVGGSSSIINALQQGSDAAYSAANGIQAAQGGTLEPITVSAYPAMSPAMMAIIGVAVLGGAYLLLKKRR